jgi:hypothetical protein
MVTALFVCLVALQSPAGAQAPASAPAQRVSGVWALNKDLSTKPASLPRQNPQGGDRGGGGGRRGGFGGGRMGGGRSGGGRSSGRDAITAMSLIRELGLSPEQLTIVLHDAALTITDSDGVSRKFAVDGKSEKVAIGGDSIDVKSRWHDEAIEQEFKIGSTKLVRLIETTTDGHQLVISVRPAKDDGAGRFDRFVYDRKPLLQ